MKKVEKLSLLASILMSSNLSMAELVAIEEKEIGNVKVSRHVIINNQKIDLVEYFSDNKEIDYDNFDIGEVPAGGIYDEEDSLDFIFEFDSDSIIIPIEDFRSMPLNDWTI